MTALPVTVRELAREDYPHVLGAWQRSSYQAPRMRRIPWQSFKTIYGTEFAEILQDRQSLVLGAYADGVCVGFLVASPGKRVDVLHWVQTNFKHPVTGEHVRRRGVMTALLSAADLGSKFIFTLRARREGKRALDDILAERLAARGVLAIHTDFREWLKD